MVGKETLGLMSVAIATVGYGFYFWSVWKRRTKPHVFSWLVWALLAGIVFAAQYVGGAGPGSWVLGVSAAECFIIMCFALVWGEKDIKKSDWAAFIGALAAIPIWRLTGNPLWAVVWATIIDVLSFYPTFRKTYVKPYEESPSVYAFDLVKVVLALFAIETFSLTNTFYYFSIFSLNLAFLAMLYWRRRAACRRRA